jgi:hypothetical protein
MSRSRGSGGGGGGGLENNSKSDNQDCETHEESPQEGSSLAQPSFFLGNVDAFTFGQFARPKGFDAFHPKTTTVNESASPSGKTNNSDLRNLR